MTFGLKKIILINLFIGLLSLQSFAFRNPQDSIFKLKQVVALENYLHLLEKKKNEFKSIKFQKISKPLQWGDTSSILISVKKKLLLLGDYNSNSFNNNFDSNLLECIHHFQKRQGLKTSDVINTTLINELNRPVESVISQIKINIKRWKNFDSFSENEFIFINLPDYNLYLYKQDHLIIKMKVIIGKTDRKTPQLKSRIDQIVLCPYWNIPNSILQQEILPLIKRFPNYLSTYNMEWNGNKLRQLPGKSNALGSIKFLFPNPFHVYLHDTPIKNLFNSNQRAYSHGCMRIEDAKKLALYLLEKDSNWTEQRVSKVIENNKEVFIKLQRPIPIFVNYFTAWVDEKGSLQLRKDIYHLDVTE